jgi:hypothetical protein
MFKSELLKHIGRSLWRTLTLLILNLILDSSLPQSLFLYCNAYGQQNTWLHFKNTSNVSWSY